ncbi:MAG: MFS transporter [Planctomycetes bacterium]|nr:MFS transporter [Planctomycetota bacterium]
MVGLTYATYYVNRYNLSIASSTFCKFFGFDNQQYGLIQSGRNWSYAIGQFCNGLIADRIGGRASMAIGGYGTAVMNVLFGLGWYYGVLGPVFGTLAWFVAIRSIDGYVQAFGAPGMVKMNTAWFVRAERGRFAGIFGLMINLGRFLNNTITPASSRHRTSAHFVCSSHNPRQANGLADCMGLFLHRRGALWRG